MGHYKSICEHLRFIYNNKGLRVSAGKPYTHTGHYRASKIL